MHILLVKQIGIQGHSKCVVTTTKYECFQTQYPNERTLECIKSHNGGHVSMVRTLS